MTQNCVPLLQTNYKPLGYNVHSVYTKGMSNYQVTEKPESNIYIQLQEVNKYPSVLERVKGVAKTLIFSL